MSSVPPVVDYKRMERLRPPENTVIPINANTICIFIILISIIGMYKRHVDLNKPRPLGRRSNQSNQSNERHYT